MRTRRPSGSSGSLPARAAPALAAAAATQRAPPALAARPPAARDARRRWARPPKRGAAAWHGALPPRGPRSSARRHRNRSSPGPRAALGSARFCSVRGVPPAPPAVPEPRLRSSPPRSRRPLPGARRGPSRPRPRCPRPPRPVPSRAPKSRAPPPRPRSPRTRRPLPRSPLLPRPASRSRARGCKWRPRGAPGAPRPARLPAAASGERRGRPAGCGSEPCPACSPAPGLPPPRRPLRAAARPPLTAGVPRAAAARSAAMEGQAEDAESPAPGGARSAPRSRSPEPWKPERERNKRYLLTWALDRDARGLGTQLKGQRTDCRHSPAASSA